MSETLELWPEIQAICEKAGLEAGSVQNIIITPASVIFDVYDEPKRFEGYGPVTVTIAHPWKR